MTIIVSVYVSAYSDVSPFPSPMTLEQACHPTHGFKGTLEERVERVADALAALGALLGEKGICSPEELIKALDPTCIFEKVVK